MAVVTGATELKSETLIRIAHRCAGGDAQTTDRKVTSVDLCVEDIIMVQVPWERPRERRGE